MAVADGNIMTLEMWLSLISFIVVLVGALTVFIRELKEWYIQKSREWDAE